MEQLTQVAHAVTLAVWDQPAQKCELAKFHAPKPLRFVWHHIVPQACGGKTETANLIQVCDSCHYSVHRLLWQLANGGITTPGSRAQNALAKHAYALIQTAGTTAKIPREGLCQRQRPSPASGSHGSPSASPSRLGPSGTPTVARRCARVGGRP